MRRILKGLGIALLAVLVIGGAVFAYTAITVTSEVEVKEPISIFSVEGDGTFDSGTGTWNIGEIYPLDNPALTIILSNASSGTITLNLAASPASLDGGNLTFNFDNEILEVPAGGTATVTLTANTTQSLAPGSYSTEVTVER